MKFEFIGNAACVFHGSNDTKLLMRILDKKSHWNNGEIKAHINFTRSPNKMEPDVHTCLSFFHL